MTCHGTDFHETYANCAAFCQEILQWI